MHCNALQVTSCSALTNLLVRLCHAMPGHAMPCHAMLCYAMLCYAMLCYAMLCYAMLCYAMLCYCMLCCAVLCCAVLCCAVLCSAMLCYAMLCYAMLCYAMLCYAMLCYAMLCRGVSVMLPCCVLLSNGLRGNRHSRPTNSTRLHAYNTSAGLLSSKYVHKFELLCAARNNVMASKDKCAAHITFNSIPAAQSLAQSSRWNNRGMMLRVL